jgi:hypothetical protein
MWLLRALALVVLAPIGCGYLSDTVTSSYSTVADARSDGLFDRGWLPDVLPASSHDIRTSNNLDLSTSFGEFAFAAADGPQFYSLLTAGAPSASRLAGWSSIVDGYSNRGYSAWSFKAGKYTWAFFCNKESTACDYYLW